MSMLAYREYHEYYGCYGCYGCDGCYEGQFRTAPAPLVFLDTAEPFILEWVALATDGELYTAPAVPGGWLQRSRYTGPIEALSPISIVEARTVAWFLYGDEGIDNVAIAQSYQPDGVDVQHAAQQSRIGQSRPLQHSSDEYTPAPEIGV